MQIGAGKAVQAAASPAVAAVSADFFGDRATTPAALMGPSEAMAGAGPVEFDLDDSDEIPVTGATAQGYGGLSAWDGASAAPKTRIMRRSGRLMIDPNRMCRVHSRFAGQVVAIGDVAPVGESAAEPSGEAAAERGPAPGPRTLRFGDTVRRGQLLAVVWSKEVGEKKSDLVDALSSLYMHRRQCEQLRSLERGLVPQRQVSEADQQYEADLIAVDRIERTLRSWRVDEAEIAEVRAEAERLHRGDGAANPRLAESWAEVDIRAPLAGAILEKNITVGDIVDTSLDLFKVGDLDSLLVIIDVFEEDLPALESLPPGERRWTVRLKATPHAAAIPGAFEAIGNIVDPMQHTVALMGTLDNSGGLLRAGQFVTADIPHK